VIMAEETFEEIRAIAFEQIEAMIVTLDTAGLFDHLDDRRATTLGAIMFSVIVDRLRQARTEMDAARARSGEA